jgi:type IV secretory pathway TrbL component
MASGALDDAVGGKRDDIQSELDAMSANSDVEQELAMLKGELTAGAPKQIEGSAANGESQAAQQAPASPPAQGPFVPPPPPPPAQTTQQQAEQAQPDPRTQQAQPAGLPVADLPGLADEQQDGDGS